MAACVLPSQIPFCRDNRQVSRIVSYIWKDLTSSDRARFSRLAEEEKRLHKLKYPEYVSPLHSDYSAGKKELSKSSSEKAPLNPEERMCKKIAHLIGTNVRGEGLVDGIQKIISENTGPTYVKSTSQNAAAADYTPKKTKTVALVPKLVASKTIKPPPTTSSPKKIRSSTSAKHKSKASLSGTSLYARMVNPPRHGRVLSYAEPEEENLSDYEKMIDSFSSRTASLPPSTPSAIESCVTEDPVPPMEIGVVTPPRSSSPYTESAIFCQQLLFASETNPFSKFPCDMTSSSKSFNEEEDMFRSFVDFGTCESEDEGNGEMSFDEYEALRRDNAIQQYKALLESELSAEVEDSVSQVQDDAPMTIDTNLLRHSYTL